MRIFFLLCLFASQSFGLAGGKHEINIFSRGFYDDNIFMHASNAEPVDSFYHSHNITGKSKLFRDRVTLSKAIEFRRRIVDDQTFLFGSTKIKAENDFGPRLNVKFDNGFSHSEREPSDFVDASSNPADSMDVTFFSNKSKALISWQNTYLDKFRYGYEKSIKRWSDNLPLGNDLTNGDYTKNTHSLILERINNRRFITEVIGTKSDLEYNGNRGGYDSHTLTGQITYVPNSYMVIKGMYGRHWSTILNQAGNYYDTSRPVYGANVTFFTPRGTTLGFNLIYDVSDSGAGYWNAKENRKAMVIAKYPFTPKTEISFMGLWMQTEYFAEYNRYEGLDLERLEDIFVSSVTLTWNYNRNHYAEIGYQGMHLFNRDADVFKNKVFIGYKLKF
jgi:hypothetical protein